MDGGCGGGGLGRGFHVFSFCCAGACGKAKRGAVLLVGRRAVICPKLAVLQADTCYAVTRQAGLTQGLIQAPDFRTAAVAEGGRRAAPAERDMVTRWTQPYLSDTVWPCISARGIRSQL